MRRFLALTFTLCCVPTLVAAAPKAGNSINRLRTIEAGQEATIGRHAQWGSDCKSLEVPLLKIEIPPKHGKIRSDVTQFVLTRTLPDSRHTHCLGKEATGAALLYTPDPKFVGQDEVSYTVNFTKRRNGTQKVVKQRVVLNVARTAPAPNAPATSGNVDELKSRQSTLERTQRAIADEQAKSGEQVKAVAEKQAADVANLALKQANDVKQIKEKQTAQDAVQGKLVERQVQSEGETKRLAAALGGIVLPAWQKPNEWMMRVAAVPVQQQQFCRIVDSFYDRLNDVYKTQNEIKRNALFRERKQDLAALLPGGNFENWVVQVVEVTQAPDGSAAVMLQPPCRAMMGSDACQRRGSEIKATIPKQSPTFRELERVNGGDFVVVSGKMLYADSASFDDPLPTYAVYEPGSHCSASMKGRDADVFVTDIKYLVQLR